MTAKNIALAALALPWNAYAIDVYVCRATISLRTGGTNDTIGLANQAQQEHGWSLSPHFAYPVD